MPKYECGVANCPFLVRTADEDEIVAIVQRHTHHKHDRSVDEEYVSSRLSWAHDEDKPDDRQ